MNHWGWARVAVGTVLVLGAQLLSAQHPPSQRYVWKSVQMVGGGFVDGIVFHPTAKDVRYARTDIGGAYRWESRSKQWVPILDWLSYENTNLMGVESIALDPSDPSRVYLACGMYTNSRSPNADILRSMDRGKTFQRTELPFKMGGNENGRGNGERLAVDPNAGNILYFGSRLAGLWKSSDFGATWTPDASFPIDQTLTKQPSGGVGTISVIFDPTSGSKGRGSSTIYAAVSAASQDNLFKSLDSGATWHPIPNEPTKNRPTHMVLAGNGTLYLTYGSSAGPSRMTDGSVWKLETRSGTWTDITPEKPDPTAHRFGYAAISVQADNPSVLIASTFGHPGGEEIFRSLDAGATWKPVIKSGAKYDFSLAPYVSKTPIHWLFDIKIDPRNPNHATFTTGYGGYETYNLSDVDRGKPVVWQVVSKGIEETVALELLSPPSGVHLFSAIGDYGGFVHWDVDKPSPEGNYGNPTFGNTNSVACAYGKPDVVVRVGTAAGNRGGGNIGYSVDGGKTWQPPATTPQPNSRLGRIAVSEDAAVWVWTPAQSVPYWTSDNGKSWTACSGLPRNMRVIADTVNPRKFYALDLFGGMLYVSTDGGASFTNQPLQLAGPLPERGGNRGDNRGGQDWIYVTPGKEGELWISAFEGLYHATDLSKPFAKISGVEQIHAFGFGKAAPGSSDPALYLVGIIGGQRGVFRSDNFGTHWVRINDDQHQWGLILQVTGDPRIYGRVYVGTHGRGVLYGDIKH